MTEYKQLTASGLSVRAIGLHDLADRLVSPGAPDGMFTAGEGRFLLFTPTLPPSSPCACTCALMTSSFFTTPQVLHPNPTSSPGRPSFAGQKIRPS
jgi:hypothetical protein